MLLVTLKSDVLFSFLDNRLKNWNSRVASCEIFLD